MDRYYSLAQHACPPVTIEATRCKHFSPARTMFPPSAPCCDRSCRHSRLRSIIPQSVPSRVSTSAECQIAAAQTLHAKTLDVTTVHSSSLPPGLSYSGSVVTFNNNTESATECQGSQECICRDATSQHTYTLTHAHAHTYKHKHARTHHLPPPPPAQNRNNNTHARTQRDREGERERERETFLSPSAGILSLPLHVPPLIHARQQQ